MGQSKKKPSKISNDKYLDFVLVDFLIQIESGVPSENCRVRFTKKDLEHFIKDNGLTKLNET